ncbi:nucleotide disphospho-sugar-binding domain-containing protein [Aestuariivirga sp.]|uniref:nucleotide disphospho-sugar-binding domain-containing protein n=1 Tax=Aestuariivirga sp. TaxID=2650926 RepID=UPI0039E3ACE6
MTILISAWGSTGEHAAPAALCATLIGGGVTIHVLASAAHRDLYPVADPYFHALPAIDLSKGLPPRLHITGEVVRQWIDPLTDEQFGRARRIIKRHGITSVMSSWITPGVIAAAQAEGVPVVPLHLYPLPVMAEDDLPIFTRWPRLTGRCRSSAPLKQSVLHYFRSLAPRLMGLRASLGLPDDGGLLPGAGGTGLALFPNILMRTSTPHQFVTLPMPGITPLPSVVTDFLERGPPPVLIFLGSLTRFHHAAMEIAMTEVMALGKRCIAVWGDARPIRLTRPGCLEFGHFPITGLLPHAEAVIHHGGINTVAAILRAGKPSLVLPLMGDQLDNASRLADLGSATHLHPRHISGARIRSALGRALEPAMANKAQMIAHLSPPPLDAESQSCLARALAQGKTRL